MTSFLLGLQFLSIIQFKNDKEIDLEKLGKSTAYFPLIGLLLGLILIAANFIYTKFLPQTVANILLLITLIAVRGGFHLDGFADTIDGFFSGRDKEKILEIMKDSRIGSHGVVGLVCLILFKFTLLNSISELYKWKALLIMPVFGQLTMVFPISLYPYARKEGLGKIFAEHSGVLQLTIASITALIIMIFLFKAGGLILIIGFLISVFILTRFSLKKINGFTGDVYGAIEELMEVIMLFMILVLERIV